MAERILRQLTPLAGFARGRQTRDGSSALDAPLTPLERALMREAEGALATTPPVFRSPFPRPRPVVGLARAPDGAPDSVPEVKQAIPPGPLAGAPVVAGPTRTPARALNATGAPLVWKPGSAPVRLPSRRVRLRKPGNPARSVPVARNKLPVSAPSLPAPVLPSVSPAVVAPSGGRGLCGHRGIVGTTVPPVRGPLPGCYIAQPVRVAAVDGVSLSHASVMDCGTAVSLQSWVENTVNPTFRFRGGVSSLKVISGYSCRTRNSRPGAKLSEHAKGRAIDIAAVRLNSGVEITVLEGWRDPRYRSALRKLHDGACGPFGTVLGPDANRYHKDHLHLDTARYPGGPYCR